MFARAEVLAEGRPSGSDFFATVMLTIDLSQILELRETIDAAAAHRVAELLVHHPQAEQRTLAIARAEAERLCQTPLCQAQADIRVRAAGLRVHLDVDLQGKVVARSL